MFLNLGGSLTLQPLLVSLWQSPRSVGLEMSMEGRAQRCLALWCRMWGHHFGDWETAVVVWWDRSSPLQLVHSIGHLRDSLKMLAVVKSYCTFWPRRILAPKLTYIRIFFKSWEIFWLEIPNMNITNSGIDQFWSQCVWFALILST